MDAMERYDVYWRTRDRERSGARSVERASGALLLLERGGVRRGRLLDAGCGPGWALERFRGAGFDATGIDASQVAVREAKSRGLDARVADLERPPREALGDAGFDVVVLLEVLEHLLDPLGVLRRLGEVLEPGGRLVVSLPNEIALPARLSILFGRLPFGGHEDPHVRHFDRGAARRLFDAAGCEVLAELPVSVVPPRAKLLRPFFRPLVRLFPGAFAIATLYLLGVRDKDARNGPER
ncbi:MAG TPA: class I SAM-dependent methyltransferase [Planctomycetota bacterium]|nr:class I SAM-dependent methyltransferase [Planctomycetota bacterium]